jgi:hypothetical protein
MKLTHKILKIFSSVSKKIFRYKRKSLPREVNVDIVAASISNLLLSDKPVMIAKFGATELLCMINYLGVKQGRPNLIKYVLGQELDWWWRDSSLLQMEQWSGFFPPTIVNVEQFCELMIQDIKEIDILASWLPNEVYFKNELQHADLIQGLFLDPFWSKNPWTQSLAGKKVLVVHPFASDINKQYLIREKLFENPLILPQFNLITIKAVQSIGGESEFETWFDAFNYMKAEINKHDYDICLIGCGAYGLPLAAHVKRMGKKAVHIGGSLQLLFGIKGKRWENPLYGSVELGVSNKYPNLMNKYWVRPGKQDTPKSASNVEGACYW